MSQPAGAASPDTAGPVERIGRIARLIESSGDRNEALGQLAPEAVDALHGQRIFFVCCWRRTVEALGKLDASSAWCVGQINGCSARWGGKPLRSSS